MPVFNIAEAIDVTRRVHGLSLERVASDFAPLLGDAVTALAPVEEDAWSAADLRVRHYHRSTRPLSMADCFLLAAARPRDRLATADPVLAEAARAEGIEVIALPDRGGRRP